MFIKLLSNSFICPKHYSNDPVNKNNQLEHYPFETLFRVVLKVGVINQHRN